MRAWGREHGLAFWESVSRLGRFWVATLLNVLVFGVSLSLPAAFLVVLKNVEQLSPGSSAEPQLTVFLQPTATPSETGSIATRLRAHPAAARVEFVPKDKALEGLKDSAGLTGVLEELGSNPLPDSFVVSGRQGNLSGLEALKAESARWPGVEHVQLDSLWARQLDAIVRTGRILAGIVALILGVALLAVTFNTTRLQILGRREEIEVSKLIGATNAFIRRPFLYSGTLQGLLGALLCVALVRGTCEMLQTQLGAALTLVAPAGSISTLSWLESLIVIAVSAAIGWSAAWLSVAFFLRRLDP